MMDESETTTGRRVFYSFLEGLFLLFVVVLSSCTGSMDQQIDNTTDGDTTENYETADGDSDLAEQEKSPAQTCSTSADCSDENSCDPYSSLCRNQECSTDAECSDMYSEAYYCSEDSICLPMECELSEECPEYHYCSSGFCTLYGGCEDVSDIMFESVVPLVRTGEQRRITVRVLDKNGAAIPQAFDIQWSSMNSSVVSIAESDVIANMAAAVGGSVSGTTTIMAKLDFSDTFCSGKELSITLSMQNFAVHDDDLRVIVTNSLTGKTVGDATVMVNNQSIVTPSDANSGVAIFNGVTAPYTIHVFHDNYHYKSLIDINESDVLIPLEPFEGLDQKAGIKTKINLSEIPEILRNDLVFGVAGMANVKSLLDVNVNTLFSGGLLREMPFQGPFHDELAIPSNVTIEASTPVSENLYIEGAPGSHLAWAIGGFVNTTDMVQIVTNRLYDGWSDVGAFLLSGMAFSGTFYHGMVDGIELEAHSMIQDKGTGEEYPLNIEDLNDDGSTTDYIPDYSKFSQESNITLTQLLRNSAEVTMGKLPLYSKPLDGIFTVLGTRTIDRQFVPLGMGNMVVTYDGTGEKPSYTTVGEINVKYAPHYSNLKNDYVVISYALPIENLCNKDNPDMSYSAIIKHFNTSPDTADMGDFIEFSPFATVNLENRMLSYIQAAGGDLHRLSFEKNGRHWDFYKYGATEGYEKINISVPIPSGDDPLTGAVTVTSIEMTQGTDLDDLAAFNAKTLANMDSYVKRYSVYHFHTDDR